MSRAASAIDRAECPRCEKSHDTAGLLTVCDCGGPLLVRYRMKEAADSLKPESLRDRRNDQWRYTEVLPDCGEPVSLGEGMTPLVDAPGLARKFGLSGLSIKDESVNPTGSFKARGLSAAVSVAVSRGVTSASIPSAGNAGSALAAYGARAGIEVDVYLPRDTPAAFVAEARLHGARLHMVDGTIADCAKQMRSEPEHAGRFDVSTLREPYRIEGKKTMAYELWEQTRGELFDALVYPTGGGTGIIGMWKAFAEIEELGWPMARRPRMISVQARGCAPIVTAWENGSARAEPCANPHTVAAGLRVPAALGDFLILSAVRESGGAAFAVRDEELIDGAREMARETGVAACPEGGATLAVLSQAMESGVVREGDRVVLFNTGTGLKYLDILSAGTGGGA